MTDGEDTSSACTIAALEDLIRQVNRLSNFKVREKRASV